MKKIWITAFACLLIAYLSGCTKSGSHTSNNLPGTPTGSTPDSTITDSNKIVPKSHSDTLTFVQRKWKSYQDTVSVINYTNGYGQPLPGVLYNPPGDYWDFEANGNIDVILEGAHFTTSYQFLTDDKLLIAGLPSGLTLPSTITTLTAKTFIFICTDTSATGGTYYRRVWLTD